MAKKILSAVITCCIIIVFACGLTSCGEKKGDDAVTTVSAEEWKSAFNFSKYSNYTITVEEVMAGLTEDEYYSLSGTITVENGMPYYNYVEKFGTEEEVWQEQEYVPITSLSDFESESLWELATEIEDNDDYAYSLFGYQEKTQSYYATLNMDGLACATSIYFKDGKISKITLSVKNEMGTLECSYQFNYN